MLIGFSRGMALMGALSAPAMAAAQAQDAPPERPWTLSASAGIATMQGQGDQPFVSLGLGREFGESYVKLTGTMLDNKADQGVLNTVPARTWQLALSGGTSFGALSMDASVSLGRRDFQAEAYTRANGNVISVESDGKLAGAGIALAYDVPISRSVFLSPFASLDYDRVDIARAVVIPATGLVARKEKQDGVSGAAGATLQHMLGKSGSSIGLYGAFATTSNTTAYGNTRVGGVIRQPAGLRDGPGGADSWGEYGATASFSLSDQLTADLSIIRTAGFAPGESTSGAIGLRINF
ncbi:autotransporter outer membrane beta-barrel domain-containing protein [Sphingobium boeckii]|uniref:Autotransporter domain-containing protein n=1 Tax=Sphingobium boeckii TaxID=1082345 RepID=A0A7W9AHA7_9SPHN|nr:autotransporter outer membrane beta-barrel domain-containing protein [Sphingobium boeckii]MBB5685558.1 hypothetical protein [Sphingobium boeckii]